MAAILESIKATLIPASENGSAPSHSEPAQTPDLSSAPGGYKEDETSPQVTPSIDKSQPSSTTNEPTLPDVKNTGLGGAIHAPHLSAQRQDSLDALSTKAVKNEPVDYPAESERPSNSFSGLQAEEDSSTPASDTGLHPRVASKFARDLSKYNSPESTLAPHPEGKPGTYDVTGKKIHEATESQPGSFGVLGGAHLNSPDNKPETAGTSSVVPELEPDQGAQMVGILAPGPALTHLPPTEPTSSTATPQLSRSGGDDTSSSYEQNKLPLSNEIQDTKNPIHQAESEASSTSVHTSDIPTTASRIGSQDPTLNLDPRRSLAATEKNGIHDDEHGSHKVKVPLGDKIKGFVTEIKGVVKKDPEIKEHGKALRTGNA